MKLLSVKKLISITILLTLILISTKTMHAQTNDYLNQMDDWEVMTVENNDQLKINLSYSENNINKFQSSNQIPLSEFTVDENTDGKAYKLSRDAGTVDFLPNGAFEFQANKAYHDKLKDQLPGEVSKGFLMLMTLGSIDSEALDVLKAEEVPLNVPGLLALSSKGVDAGFLKEKIAVIKNNEGKELSLENLLLIRKFNATGKGVKTSQRADTNNAEPSNASVDEAYIKMLHDLGYTSLVEKDVMDGKSLGVTADYIKEIKAQGYDELSFSTLVSFKSMKITGDWIANANKENGTQLSSDQLISIRKGEEKGARKGSEKEEMKRKMKMKMKNSFR